MTQPTIIKLFDREIPIPQSWNDLSLQQAMTIYLIIFRETGRLFAPAELHLAQRYAIIMHLLGLTEQQMRDWKQARIEENEGEEIDGKTIFFTELSEIFTTLDFLFERVPTPEEEDRELYQVKLALTQCPYPKLTFPAHKNSSKKNIDFHAPADALENLSLYELATTFTLFEQFVNAEKEAEREEFAVKLLATIYRPAKADTRYNRVSDYEGDIRRPYLKHETTVARREPRLRKLPREVKQFLLFWFACCRHQIIQSYPDVFDRSNTGDPNRFGWGGVLMAMAGGLVHLDEINNQPYQNGLIYLTYLEDQRQKREREAKRAERLRRT